MNRIKNFWNSGIAGKVVIAGASLLVLCCLCSIPIAIFSPETSTVAPTETAPGALATQAEAPMEIVLPTNTPEPTATLEPRTALKAEIERVLRMGNRNVPRLTELNFDDPEPGAMFVHWTINDNLTENLIKFGAKSDATDILKAIAMSGIDYTYIILSGSFPLVDEFGNSKETNVVNLTFYKATVGQINWENFLSDNIYNIADEANIWVAFQD